MLDEVAVAGLTFSLEFLLTRVLSDVDPSMIGELLERVCCDCVADTVADVAALLLEHSAAVDLTSVLVAALASGAPPAAQLALVAMLVRAGADATSEEVLVEACENNCSIGIVKLLIDAGAPASIDAAFAAAEAGASAAFEAICHALEAPLDIKSTNELGNTLLHFAQLGVDTLARLIDAGADLHMRNRDGLTPLMVVTPDLDDEFFLLLARGSDPNTAIPGKTGGYSVLHHAVASARPERVRRLLAAGAKPDAKDGAGQTPLFYAEDAESVQLLTAAGLSPNEFTGGRTPLVAALRKPEVLRALLSAGGETGFLLYTCMRHSGDHTNAMRQSNRECESNESDELASRCAQLLIDAGADVHGVHFRGETVLHIAAQRANGHRSMLTLFDNGALADLHRPDERGRTARDFANESCSGGLFGLDERVDVEEHEGVLMLVAAGVEPLPAWIAPLSAPDVRERIELFRFHIVRRRATEILVALHGLSISALELVHIVEAAVIGEHELSFALVWQLVTTVKHFKGSTKSVK